MCCRLAESEVSGLPGKVRECGVGRSIREVASSRFHPFGFGQQGVSAVRHGVREFCGHAELSKAYTSTV